MHTSHLRNKLHLYGRKITLLAVGLALWAVPAMCQHKTSEGKTLNLTKFDDKKIHFGFQIGFYRNNFFAHPSLQYKPNTPGATGIVYMRPEPKPGFSVGLIVNFAFPDRLWDFRLSPNFSYYDRTVQFRSIDPADTTKTIVAMKQTEAYFVELPILFKYKSVRRDNHRFFMTGGFTPSFQAGNKIQGSPEENLLLESFNFEVNYGFGIDFYLKFVCFSPELRFSHGMVNMLKINNSPYAKNLDKLTTHKVSLFLNFEG